METDKYGMLTARLEVRGDNGLGKKDKRCSSGSNNRGALAVLEVLYYFYRCAMAMSVPNVASEAKSLNIFINEIVSSTTLKVRMDSKERGIRGVQGTNYKMILSLVVVRGSRGAMTKR